MKDIKYILQTISKENKNKLSFILKRLSLFSELVLNKDKLVTLKKSLEKEEYLNALHLLFLYCVLFTPHVSTLSPPPFIEKAKLEIKQWLNNVNLLTSNGKQGDIFIGDFLFEKVILKRPKKSLFLENTLKDYFIGFHCINNIRFECSMFPYTYGIINMDKQGDELWIVSEFVKGETLKSLIKKLSFKQFLNIFAQILIALEIGQETYNFCHYDLHTGNVLISTVSKPSTYHVFIYDITVSCLYKPILIDFGMSSILTEDDMFIGQHKQESNGIFPYLFPGYDAYLFLLFSREIGNSRIVKGIDKLFKFYGEIDNSNYVDTLKNTCGRHTPLEFLEYIKNNFHSVLDMRFTDRTVWKKSYSDNIFGTIDYPITNNYIEKIYTAFNILARRVGRRAAPGVPGPGFAGAVEAGLHPKPDVPISSALLEDINTLVVSTYVILQNSPPEDFKTWIKIFKDSAVYKYYTANYVLYVREKRLNL